MDTFPRKDLPAELSNALLDCCTGAQKETESLQASFDYWKQFTGERQPDPPRELSPAEPVLGLAAIWSEAKYSFAFWDKLPGEEWWDGEFLDYIPRVQNVKSEEEYWDLPQSFVKLLKDGHTTVNRPVHLIGMQGRPPIRIR